MVMIASKRLCSRRGRTTMGEIIASRHSGGPWAGSNIHERIQQARVSAGFSRAELARRVGVGPSAAVQWENSTGTAPTLENLARIAIATGVAFEWLATGRGSARVANADDRSEEHTSELQSRLHLVCRLLLE